MTAFLGPLLWFALGPLDWHAAHPELLYPFLAAAGAALVGGYLWFVRRHPTANDLPANPPPPRRLGDPDFLLKVAAGAYAVFYFPTSYATTGSWVPDLWRGIMDPAAAYANNKSWNLSGPTGILYLRILASPLLIMVVPITLLLWRRLSRLSRVLGAACLTASAVLTISQGINKGVADLASFGLLFVALVAYSALVNKDWKRLAKSAAAAVCIAGLFFGYYSMNIRSRVAADAAQQHTSSATVTETADSELVTASTINAATVRAGHPFFTLVPKAAQPTALMLSTYVTHGYKGLSMALPMEWTPTWGLGFSDFYRHNVLKLVGRPDAEPRIVALTYSGKLTDVGWPPGLFWTTMFVPWASDLSFPGTVILMLLLGIGLAASWRGTVRQEPLAAVVFLNIYLMLVYLPANNQIFLGGESAFGFTVVTAAWLGVGILQRRRRRKAAASTDTHVIR